MGVQWRTSEREVLFTPHWGHYVAVGLCSVFCAAWSYVALEAPRAPNKSTTALYVAMALQWSIMALWGSYPLWGGQRVSFADGRFRVMGRRSQKARTEIPLAELLGFDARPGAGGYSVHAVKADGEQVQLDLAFGNPLLQSSGKGRINAERAARDFAKDATEIARRLSDMLAEAKRARAGYRG